MRRILLVQLAAFLFLSCERGLAPTEAEKTSLPLEFPIPLVGGDPRGYWGPASEDPLIVAFVDSSQIAGLVDSLILEPELSGFFRIDPFGTYEVNAVVSITPKVYVSPLPNPIVMPAVVDTIHGDGTYMDYEDDHVIVFLGLTASYFDVDTLGYSVESGPESTRRLRLVSLPNTFPFPGFDWIQFYLMFQLDELSPATPVTHLGETPDPASARNRRRSDL